MNKLPNSKRLRICIYVFHVYLIIGVVGFFYYPEHIANLAAFFGSTSVPVFGYLFAETMRPSGQPMSEETQNKSWKGHSPGKSKKKPIPPQESTDTN